jgi:hypothetical protein
MAPPERQRGPARAPAVHRLGDDRSASCSPIRPAPQDHGRLRGDPRFHRLTERLLELGARLVGELLLEVAAGRDLIEACEEYAQLDPAAVARLETRDWPASMGVVSA